MVFSSNKFPCIVMAYGAVFSVSLLTAVLSVLCLGDTEPRVVKNVPSFRLKNLAGLGNGLGKTVELNASFCTDPGVPLSGVRVPPPTKTGGKYNIGDQIILTCNQSFVLHGSNSRQCLPTGKWSGNNTQCKELPVFTTFPSNTTLSVSDTVTIKCSADTRSGEKATITWYKDGKPLGSSSRYYKDVVTNYLYIFHVLVDDDGMYTCEASNAAGKIQASMYLTVRQKQIACGKAKVRRSRGQRSAGYRPRRGSIPWQILLFDNDKNNPFCGAVLLNERWGVTAAHCLVRWRINDVVAILGKHNWKKDDNTEQAMSIAQVHYHRNFDESTYDSDIALFKFTKQAVFTDYVIPICLPTTSADFALSNGGNRGRVSGWGGGRNASSTMAERLYAVKIPIVGHKQCKTNHKKWFVSKNMLCAGRINGKGDACKGDAGGPLTVKNRATGKHVLVGIVSWGQKNKYGVYTKVNNFIAWINFYIKKI